MGRGSDAGTISSTAPFLQASRLSDHAKQSLLAGLTPEILRLVAVDRASELLARRAHDAELLLLVHDLDRRERLVGRLSGAELARQGIGPGEIEVRERGRRSERRMPTRRQSADAEADGDAVVEGLATAWATAPAGPGARR